MRGSSKRCTSDMNALDVREIAKAGLLKGSGSFAWRWKCGAEVQSSIFVLPSFDRVHLQYSVAGESMSYMVRLDFTACALGGHRVWWLCPGQGCGRRVAVLFAGRVFACRHCHGLAYRCQRESTSSRASRRTDKLRKRLNWHAGILNADGGKPKWMHWRTYWRLRAEHDTSADAAFGHLAANLDLLSRRINRVS